MGDFILDGKIITADEELSWRDVGEDLVALNTTSGEYFTFNAIGRIVWLSIAEGKSIEDVIDEIASEYSSVDKKTILSDIKLFTSELIDKGLLKASPCK